jgi:hypothetical protein
MLWSGRRHTLAIARVRPRVMGFASDGEITGRGIEFNQRKSAAVHCYQYWSGGRSNRLSQAITPECARVMGFAFPPPILFDRCLIAPIFWRSSREQYAPAREGSEPHGRAKITVRAAAQSAHIARA